MVVVDKLEVEGGKMSPRIEVEMEKKMMKEKKRGKMTRVVIGRVRFELQGKVPFWDEVSFFASEEESRKRKLSSFFRNMR